MSKKTANRRRASKQAKPTAVKPPRAVSVDVDRLPTNPDAHLTETQTAALLGVTKRKLQSDRITGDGPPFIRLSSRCVRYRLGDVLEHSASLRRHSTSDMGGVTESSALVPMAAQGRED
jgi:hypothetical protein